MSTRQIINIQCLFLNIKKIIHCLGLDCDVHDM